MTPHRIVMTSAEAATYLGISQDRLQRWRRSGEGPRFLAWGRRTVRYRLTDLDSWLNSNPSAGNTAEAYQMLQRR